MAYKVRVPVCGAILISESWDKVRRALACTRLHAHSQLYRSCWSRASTRLRHGLSREARSIRTSPSRNVLSARCVCASPLKVRHAEPVGVSHRCERRQGLTWAPTSSRQCLETQAMEGQASLSGTTARSKSSLSDSTSSPMSLTTIPLRPPQEKRSRCVHFGQRMWRRLTALPENRVVQRIRLADVEDQEEGRATWSAEGCQVLHGRTLRAVSLSGGERVVPSSPPVQSASRLHRRQRACCIFIEEEEGGQDDTSWRAEAARLRHGSRLGNR